MLQPDPFGSAAIVKTRVLVQHQQLCRLDRESAPDDYAVSADQAEALLGGTV
jgi:D-beta-D-heptose 7-phosphate kinase/D-beta-D-heptose 1-phosphate adenosyltransferase